MYAEYAFGWKELSGLLHMLMIMELCTHYAIHKFWTDFF